MRDTETLAGHEMQPKRLSASGKQQVLAGTTEDAQTYWDIKFLALWTVTLVINIGIYITLFFKSCPKDKWWQNTVINRVWMWNVNWFNKHQTILFN